MPEAVTIHKAGPVAEAGPRHIQSGMNDFTRLLGLEFPSQQEPDAPPVVAAESAWANRPRSEAANLQQRTPGPEILSQFQMVSMIYGVEIASRAQNIAQGGNSASGTDSNEVPAMEKTLRGASQLIAPTGVLVDPTPQQPAPHERFAGSHPMPDLKLPAPVTAEDGPASFVKAISEVPEGEEAETAPVLLIAVREPRTASKESGSSKTRDPSQDHVAEDVQLLASLAADQLPTAAAPSPARQILSQLEAPVTAVLQEPVHPEQAAPLRQLKISLAPDELGIVNVTLRIQGKTLLVAFEASVPETVELLRRDRSMLDDLLRPMTGDGMGAAVTILDTEFESAAGNFHEYVSGNGTRQGSSGPGAGRERSSTGKEGSSSQADERTPVHEELSRRRSSLPGTLVL